MIFNFEYCKKICGSRTVKNCFSSGASIPEMVLKNVTPEVVPT